MKIHNETQAKIIWKLSKLPELSRKTANISAEIGLAYSTINQNLSILVAGELVKKFGSGRNTFYVPTEEGITQAKEWLSIQEE